MATVGILHMGLYGHLWPACRLGDALARRGHRVVAWAPPAFREAVEASAAEYREAPAAQSAPPPRAAGHVEADFRVVAAARAAVAAATARAVIEQVAAEEVDLLVHDCMVLEGRVAGEWLGLPRICSFPLYPISPDRMPAPAPMRPEVADALQAARYRLASEWGVVLGDVEELLFNPGDLTFVYTTAQIAGVDPPDPSWVMIGPLLGHADAAGGDPALPADDGRPLVYVALGTLFSGRPDVFRGVLEALAGEDVHVLAGLGGQLDPEALGSVPANATVMRLAPGRAALRRAAVHVTHGGISSVHESLEAGVPMVCLPQGSDQLSWGWRIAELGVGETLAADASPAAIRAAVMRLLASDQPRARARQQGEHLRAYEGERIAAEAVERLLGRPSANSPTEA